MTNTSKVYVLPDEQSCILRCEGGYTMSNIEDISQWVFIDEGYGDRYNLCQSHYFPKPLYEEHGVPVYKLDNGVAVERTAEEIAEDIAAIPAFVSEPTVWDELDGAYTAGYESGYAEGVNSI